MSVLPRSLANNGHLILLVVISLSMPGMGYAHDVVDDELRLCSLIQDATLRLSCYDNVSGGPVPSTRTKLLGCSKNVNDEFFFHFENGQVWKYAYHKRLNIHNCDREATLSKVRGGHILQFDGDKRRIRVVRVDD